MPYGGCVLVLACKFNMEFIFRFEDLDIKRTVWSKVFCSPGSQNSLVILQKGKNNQYFKAEDISWLFIDWSLLIQDGTTLWRKLWFISLKIWVLTFMNMTHGSSSIDLVPAAEDEAGLSIIHPEDRQRLKTDIMMGRISCVCRPKRILEEF